jgi:lipase ATG15
MGWRLSVVNHQINNLIRDVLEVYDDVAECMADTDCVDWANWYFED